jgi:hypothetical protein
MILLGLILGAFFPRLLLFIIWLSSNLVTRAFSSFLIPLLGLLFLPYTTLAYVLSYNPIAHGLIGLSWVWVLIGFAVDFMAYSYGGYHSTHRNTYAT